MEPQTLHWDQFLATYLELLDDEKRVRAQRSGLSSLNGILSRQQKLMAQMASRVRAKGPAAERLNRALCSGDAVEATLAVRVLLHLQPFPKRFAPAVVRVLILQRKEEILQQVSQTHGWRPIFDEILRMASDGLISEKFFSFLRYYVVYSPTDDLGDRPTRTELSQRILATIQARGTNVLDWIQRGPDPLNT